MSGLFSTFNIAKRGMSVQQKSIDVTSHNIANANTVGYSRQRANIVTSTPYTSESGVGQIGTGAQISTIERIRDTFLDYQVRNETSILGKYQVRENFLYEVESILNEPSDTGLSSLIGSFFDAFQELSKQPNSSNSRTVVAQKTLALTDALNSTYRQLEALQLNAQDQLRHTVTSINSLLNQLDRVNQEIINVTVSRNTPNDLMDKRDLLIDELSSKFGIVVEREEFNGINLKPTDTGKVKSNLLVNSSPNGDVARFSYITSVDKDESDPSGTTFIVTYYKNGDMSSESNKQTLKITGINEAKAEEILSKRIIWSNKDGQAIRGDGHPIKDGDTVSFEHLMFFEPSAGSVNGLYSVQKDIQDYMNQLDKLAKAIALAVNGIHSGKADASEDTLPFFVNKDVAKYDASGNLDNIGDTLLAEEKISAKNITINEEILNDVMKIKAGKTEDSGEGDGTRALAIAQLRNGKLRIQDINESVKTRLQLLDGNLKEDGLGLINSKDGMSLDSYFKDTIDRIGVQTQEATRMVINQEDLLYSIEETRASVSGVSLDEEMANLIQFQHAYNANAKIIATIDELLEVVINGLRR